MTREEKSLTNLWSLTNVTGWMGVINGEVQQFRYNQTLGDAGGGIQTIERQLSFCAQSKWCMCTVQIYILKPQMIFSLCFEQKSQVCVFCQYATLPFLMLHLTGHSRIFRGWCGILIHGHLSPSITCGLFSDDMKIFWKGCEQLGCALCWYFSSQRLSNCSPPQKTSLSLRGSFLFR